MDSGYDAEGRSAQPSASIASIANAAHRAMRATSIATLFGQLPRNGNIGTGEKLQCHEAFGTAAPTERYDTIEETGIHGVATTPPSSCSVGIDTAAHGTLGRFPRGGNPAPPKAARTERPINYFDDGDAQPTADALTLSAEPGACPAAGFRLAAAGAESGLQRHGTEHQREASHESARVRAKEAAAVGSLD